MSQLTVNNGDTGLSARNKINNNFTELYIASNNTATLLGINTSTTANLGSFTGTTIGDNESVKTALQDLETAVELRISTTFLSTNAAANSIFTTNGNTVQQLLDGKAPYSLVGVANGSANLGSFTGSVIGPNETIKQALQDCATAIAGLTGLSNTGVTAGTYGNSSYVGSFTVTPSGIINAASQVAIEIPASKVDVSPTGNVTATTVQSALAQLDSNKLSAVGPTKIGTSNSSTYTLSGSIFDHYANSGSTNTTETDLYSDIILGQVLSTNGDKLAFNYGGTFLGSGTATRDLKIYFGGSTIFDSTALSISANCSWTCSGTIMKSAANSVNYMVNLIVGTTSLQQFAGVGVLGSLDFTSNNIIKITGTSTGTGVANNDIEALIGTIDFKPAA